jgi:predicted DNA-binding protein YlxM (UPF0122 family)
MSILWVTEKQREVLWLRFNQRKSTHEIAVQLGIQRRAVMARLRRARKRLTTMESDCSRAEESSAQPEKPRMVSSSQTPAKGQGGWSMEDL